MDTNTYPPFSPGILVKTTLPNMVLRKEWTDEAWNERKWGVVGVILTHHDSHGLFYEVRHEDRTKGCYDPSELEVIVTRCAVHGSIEHMQSVTEVCPGCGKP